MAELANSLCFLINAHLKYNEITPSWKIEVRITICIRPMGESAQSYVESTTVLSDMASEDMLFTSPWQLPK